MRLLKRGRQYQIPRAGEVRDDFGAVHSFCTATLRAPHFSIFPCKQQTLVITEKLLRPELNTLFGAGILLLTMIQKVRRVLVRGKTTDRRRGVFGVVSARVNCCVVSTIHFLLFGQRGCLPEFIKSSLKLTTRRVAFWVLGVI